MNKIVIFGCQTLFNHEPNILNTNILFMSMFTTCLNQNPMCRFRFRPKTPKHKWNKTAASLCATRTLGHYLLKGGRAGLALSGGILSLFLFSSFLSHLLLYIYPYIYPFSFFFCCLLSSFWLVAFYRSRGGHHHVCGVVHTGME